MPIVDSTAVERVEHDAPTQRLDIWYKGGGHYTYFEVPEAVYRRLLKAPSIGGFVNRRIKPFYRFSKVRRRSRS